MKTSKIFLVSILIASTTCCFAQTKDIQKESKSAAEKARVGDHYGAAKQANSAIMNGSVNKTPSPGLYGAVEKKVKEAQKNAENKPSSPSTNSSDKGNIKPQSTSPSSPVTSSSGKPSNR